MAEAPSLAAAQNLFPKHGQNHVQEPSETILQGTGQGNPTCTGHSNLDYQQSKQTPGLSPICRFCGKKTEESHHLIRTCPALNQTRMQCLGKHTLSDNDPWTLHSLL
jgi:hypothetical protein